MLPLFEKRKKDPDAFTREGLKYLKGGMYDKAIEEFRQGLKISPGHNQLHYLLGLAHLKSGNGEDAEREFKKTLEANPHHVEAKRELDALRAKNTKSTVLKKKEKFCGDINKGIPVFFGEEWEDLEKEYTEFFSPLKKSRGEESFRTHMVWQEFAFRFERRKKDTPSFFFLTERQRHELAGGVFNLILEYASSLTSSESRKERENLLKQAEWIAWNLGDETHIARLEKVFWR